MALFKEDVVSKKFLNQWDSFLSILESQLLSTVTTGSIDGEERNTLLINLKPAIIRTYLPTLKSLSKNDPRRDYVNHEYSLCLQIFEKIEHFGQSKIDELNDLRLELRRSIIFRNRLDVPAAVHDLKIRLRKTVLGPN